MKNFHEIRFIRIFVRDCAPKGRERVLQRAWLGMPSPTVMKLLAKMASSSLFSYSGELDFGTCWAIHTTDTTTITIFIVKEKHNNLQ